MSTYKRRYVRRVLSGVVAAPVILGLAVLGQHSQVTEAKGGATKDQLKNYQPGTQTIHKVGARTFPVNAIARAYTIGVSFPHFKDPYWVAEAYGVLQEANRLHINVKIQAATGYGDTTTQLRQLDTYLTQQVDGLIIGATDSKGIAPEADRAWNSGVPVVYANALAQSQRSMGVYTDDALAGVKQADFIARHDAHAKVIAFCGPPGVVWPKRRCQAFVTELHRKAPQARILALKYHDMDRAKIQVIAGNTFQAFPQATWVYNSTDLQANGVVDALRALHRKPGSVKITNLTIGQELFSNMQQHWVSYALAERPILQGKLAVDQLVMVLNGQHPPANWAVDLPGFQTTRADLNRFVKYEKHWNFAPLSYHP
jgi:protein TorT